MIIRQSDLFNMTDLNDFNIVVAYVARPEIHNMKIVKSEWAEYFVLKIHDDLYFNSTIEICEMMLETILHIKERGDIHDFNEYIKTKHPEIFV